MNFNYDKMTHTVQPKETLYSISKKYGLSVEQLTEMNSLQSTNLSIGQVLVVDSSAFADATTTTTIFSANTSVFNDNTASNSPTQNGSINHAAVNPVDYGSSVFERRQVFQIQQQNKGSYSTYVINFPSSDGFMQTGPMRDVYPSPNQVNPKGVSYAGQSGFDENKSMFLDLCQEPYYADILKYISKNEGCFDAVNSYDKAIFSFGFIQFTGAVASGSMLTRVLARLKDRDEDVFNECFGQYGLNVQNYGTPVFQVDTSYGTKEGDAAYLEVANDLRLTGAFIASGFKPSMICVQVEIALEEYVVKAVSSAVMINIYGNTYPLNQIINTQGGIAFRVDLAVNRGLSGSLAVLKKAIEQVLSESGSGDITSLDERSIIEKVAMNDVETWKKQRVLKVLDSGFSFAK